MISLPDYERNIRQQLWLKGFLDDLDVIGPVMKAMIEIHYLELKSIQDRLDRLEEALKELT